MPVGKHPRQTIEPLESRVFFAANPLTTLKATEVSTRVSAPLLALYDAVMNGQKALTAASAQQLRVDGGERVAVTIRAADVAKVTKGLAAIGFVATASFPSLHFVEGLIPVRALRVVGSIASKLGKFAITPSYAPIEHTGSVTSQADGVMEADRVRGTLPASVNGAGVKIGVLSDSYDVLGGAAGDIVSGDLPGGGVQVVAEGASGNDEGRAMLQLIHDLAPGASLAFATALGGQGIFANNIRNLANPAIGNASVIVDDVGYLDEPMFQDGVIAQAIDEVVTTRSVSYFSAAGNQATQAYESTSFVTAVATNPATGLNGNFYDFDAGAGTDVRQRVTVANGARVRLAFQWDDPFYTVSGVDTDLDLYVVDSVSGAVVASSTLNNVANQTPFETVNFLNTSGSSMQLDLMILKSAGPNSGRIKYVNYGSTTGVTIAEFATNSPTVVPHAAAARGQAVAAVPYFNQTAPESFTSKGPSTILFSPTGAPIPVEVRQTPQLAGIDGTNTTFFPGVDFEGDTHPNFFGTSAAAPHVAAVAALVRQANPSFTPADVYTRLQQTADDITSTGLGYDNVTGHGLVNAYDAVYPNVTPASVNFFDGLESGVLSDAYETRSTGNGRIQVTDLNGPATGTRHITMDTSLVTATSGLNEVTLHVNATGSGDKLLSFRQREFDGDEDDAMPASFTDSSNSDGVALSVDGINWFRIASLTGAASTSTYTQNTFNLTAIAAANGITLTGNTRIRFQQYDDFPIGLGDGMAFDDIQVKDAVAPTVTGVFVSSTAWGSPFLNFLASSGQGDAALGYRLDATAHADELPWTNLNKISVRFSEDVTLATANAFRVFGATVSEYAGSFTYDPATFTATWTLAAGSFANDKLLIRLDDALVTDANGNALDGEGDGDTLPSGNGTAGGDFRCRLNVLPGDVNRSGTVVSNDVTLVRNALNAGPGATLYTIFKDLNGSGTIVSNDVTLVRNRLNSGLPSDEPGELP